MSQTLEQQYYEMLSRTDHPVFARDFSEIQDGTSGFNAIMNRVLAKQLVRMRTALLQTGSNSFPQSPDTTSLAKWEERYFGFSKPTLNYNDRVSQLLKRRNRRVKMSITDALALCESITGQTPTIIRNLWSGGWILGQSALGLSTVLSGSPQSSASQLYLVIFAKQVDSILLKSLDEQLTLIEKGGSRHVIVTPATRWILGQSALGLNTVLG